MFEFAFSKIGYALDRRRSDFCICRGRFLYISILKNNRVYDETNPIHNDIFDIYRYRFDAYRRTLCMHRYDFECI